MSLFSRRVLNWRPIEIFLVTLCIIMGFLFGVSAQAAQVELAWDASSGPNLGGYNLYYGQTSGTYTSNIDVGNKTNFTVPSLQNGKTYYFAVAAYDSSGNLESAYSNQVSVTTPGTAMGPTADFNASPTSGNGPLIVTFNDTSNTNGNNLSWFWEFGDGGTSTAQTAVHTYQTPGTYTVKLTVTDSGGTNTKTRANYITVSASGSGSGSGSTGSRVSGGQVVLYTFEEGSGSKVRDVSGVGTPLDLTVSNPGRVSWLSGGGLAINSPTVIKSAGAASKVKNAIQASKALTIEAWVVPSNITQNGPARIVALSQNSGPDGSNFIMGQNRTKFATLVRTSVTDQFGKPLALVTSTGAAAKGVLTHVIYTRNASGTARVYVNGLEDENGQVSGNLSSWGGYPLALANEPTEDSPWLGELHLVALYDRALTGAEVERNFDAGPDLGASGGSSGGGSKLGPALLEAGEVDINHQWQRVDFAQSFVKPVVVAKPPSRDDTAPGLVRIRNVNTSGFEIRLQEWDYLDDVHGLETVGYLAMEEGSHILPDGTQVEAGRFNANNLDSDKRVVFGQAFSTAPVVLAAVASVNENDAVTTRLRNISAGDFQFRMQEQEANSKSHAMETVFYIAWEPSTGVYADAGVAFEVQRSGNVVKDKPYVIRYQSAFNDSPVFLADMQTRNGGDVANVGWLNKDLAQVTVQVVEEQSSDAETAHTTEDVGYMLFSPLP